MGSAICFIEIPGYVVSMKLYKKLGLKKTLILSYILCLIAAMCLLFVPDQEICPSEECGLAMQSGFLLLGKFGIAATFNLAYIGNYYLFPVGIVCTSYGICNILSRVSSIASPLVAEMEPNEISKWSFSGLVITSLIASILIKDKRSKRKTSQLMTPS